MESYIERYSYKSRCPVCRKFLTEPSVVMKITSENKTGYEYIRRNCEIVLSAQTMCRRCREVKETNETAFKK